MFYGKSHASLHHQSHYRLPPSGQNNCSQTRSIFLPLTVGHLSDSLPILLRQNVWSVELIYSVIFKSFGPLGTGLLPVDVPVVICYLFWFFIISRPPETLSMYLYPTTLPGSIDSAHVSGIPRAPPLPEIEHYLLVVLSRRVCKICKRGGKL